MTNECPLPQRGSLPFHAMVFAPDYMDYGRITMTKCLLFSSENRGASKVDLSSTVGPELTFLWGGGVAAASPAHDWFFRSMHGETSETRIAQLVGIVSFEGF